MGNIKHNARTSGVVGVTILILCSGAALAQPPAPAPGSVPDWHVSSRTSAFDGTTRYSALLDAVGKIPNVLGRLQTVTLIVRCVPGSGLSSYIAWPLFMGSRDLEVAYRFDQAGVRREVWSASEDGKATGLFEGSRSLTALLDQLANSKRLVVQAPSYQSLPVEAEFDLGNAGTVVAAARKACA